MVAKLAFRDLSPEQMQQIRSPKLPQGLTVRDYLAQVAGPLDPDEEPRDAILLDLYIQTLQFGQSLGMTDEKLSGLFSLVKDLHMRSTQQRLTVENAFKLFKNMLLENSIQRPPFSTGLFAYTEMQAVLNWGLDTYFRHYKLYQYAFTHRVTMTVTSTTLLDAIELPPPLQPLAASITQAQHEAQLAEAERVRAEKEAAEQAERDRQAELDRQARVGRLLHQRARRAAGPLVATTQLLLPLVWGQGNTGRARLKVVDGCVATRAVDSLFYSSFAPPSSRFVNVNAIAISRGRSGRSTRRRCRTRSRSAWRRS